MIRKKVADNRLFYGAEELYRPSKASYYTRLDAAVGDWEALCSPLRKAFYEGKNGRPVDPVVYFKIYLVGYIENVTYDTELAERIADSLSIRQFLGYAPHEKTPDHASISRIRGSYGGVLTPVLESVVGLCDTAGLVSGREVAADSTLIPANACLSSLKCVTQTKSVRQHFDEARASNRRTRLSNEEFRSSTDPDARIAMKGARTPRRMYHKATHVTDSKKQIILAADVACADVGDSHAVLAPLEQAASVLEACEKELGLVVMDAGYDDGKLHAKLEEMGAAPLANPQRHASKKPAGFAKADFRYDAARDCYVCPAGKRLHRNGKDSARQQYRSLATDCEHCPFKNACLEPGHRNRSVNRGFHEEASERNRIRAQSPEGHEALRKRGAIVEPPFGHMKGFGGLSRLNCRTQPRVRAKIQMAAIAWNLAKLVRELLFWLLQRLWTTLKTRNQQYQPV